MNSKRDTEVVGITRRVLLAEDCPDTLMLIRKMLEDLGTSVTIAHNGQECVDIAQRTPGDFDLVILDISMPVMNGNLAARTLRDVGFNKPIVAISGHSSPLLHSSESGVDFFFNKSVVKKGLLKALLENLG